MFSDKEAYYSPIESLGLIVSENVYMLWAMEMLNARKIAMKIGNRAKNAQKRLFFMRKIFLLQL